MEKKTKKIYFLISSAKLICHGYGQMKSAVYQLKMDMEPRNIWIPKYSGDSLGHQCCLTTCVLGKYPSLHDLSKNHNHFATNDNSWFTSWVGTRQLGRGHYPFLLACPLNDQLLRGSCGTPHNYF